MINHNRVLIQRSERYFKERVILGIITRYLIHYYIDDY